MQQFERATAVCRFRAAILSNDNLREHPLMGPALKRPADWPVAMAREMALAYTDVAKAQLRGIGTPRYRSLLQVRPSRCGDCRPLILGRCGPEPVRRCGGWRDRVRRMAFARLSSYVRPIRLIADKARYYFELSAWARPTKDSKNGKLTSAVRHGQACPVISTALGSDLARYTRGAPR
ncbi:hypothetical protein HMP09_1247 [Sphingomonas sp. HMP9]|nr:hypothetical protein HMP09_1247 [Sphingomonas sp. HMP9]